MGVLPLQFINGANRKSLNLNGSELFTVKKLENGIQPAEEVELEIKYNNGDIKKIKVLARIDTINELEYYIHGGILQYVLRNII